MESLATKYRPRTLDQVIGQDVVVQTLKNAMVSDKLVNAYLLVGHFGSGKTSVARILAAMENCTVSPGINPCGNCSVCRPIFNGSHADIIEIDAASGAGKVDQIRELKKDAAYAPIDGAKTKIFILDEAHRCSAESHDALLKVIEEPPPRVRFILCTTDVQKMRPAIESRCQRHDFRKVHWSLMSEHLEWIAKQENITIDKAALNLCARLANGSVRSAIVRLEKLLAFAGARHITTDDAQLAFGQVGETLYFSLIDQVIGVEDQKPDAAIGFRIINEMLSTGTDFTTIYAGIVEHLNNLLIGLTSSRANELLALSEEGRRRFSVQYEACKKGKKLAAVIASIRNLHEAKRAVDLNLSTETALQSWFVESVCDFRR